MAELMGSGSSYGFSPQGVSKIYKWLGFLAGGSPAISPDGKIYIGGYEFWRF